MPIDYSKYHPDWKKISEYIRFTRAKNKCEWCGAENYKPHPVTKSKVILTVAHIDQNKNNNKYSNLAALCQRCHLNHDREHHIKMRAINKERRENEHYKNSLFGGKL
jgi:5-methylcytosine-specific restriction endonuclease McrA